MGESAPTLWRVERYSRKSWVVVRHVRSCFVQYMGADGQPKKGASRFRSREAAEAAIRAAERKEKERADG